MKPFSIVIILMFFGVLTAQNTDETPSKIQFGISLGGTLSKISFDEKFFGPNSEGPGSEYRRGFGMYTDLNYLLNDNFYLPISLGYLNRRFAVETGGTVLAIDNQGNLVYIQTNYYEFNVNQLSSKIGFGYQILPNLGIEVQPYFQYNITDNRVKISKEYGWQKSEFYQTTYDYGISGAVKLSINRFYLKGTYDYGLKKQEEFAFTDANGLPIGKASIRNSMFTLFFGYRFI